MRSLGLLQWYRLGKLQENKEVHSMWRVQSGRFHSGNILERISHNQLEFRRSWIQWWRGGLLRRIVLSTDPSSLGYECEDESSCRLKCCERSVSKTGRRSDQTPRSEKLVGSGSPEAETVFSACSQDRWQPGRYWHEGVASGKAWEVSWWVECDILGGVQPRWHRENPNQEFGGCSDKAAECHSGDDSLGIDPRSERRRRERSRERYQRGSADCVVQCSGQWWASCGWYSEVGWPKKRSVRTRSRRKMRAKKSRQKLWTEEVESKVQWEEEEPKVQESLQMLQRLQRLHQALRIGVATRTHQQQLRELVEGCSTMK